MMFKRYTRINFFKIFNKDKVFPVTHLTLPQFVTTIEKVYLYNFKATTTSKSSGATDEIRGVFPR